MALTQFQSDDRNFQLMQNSWASSLNPVLSNPIVNGFVLPNLVLVTGANTINHRLGRMMQGWIVTDQNGAATVYRSAPLNNLTLTLTASAGITVSLYVF